MDKVSDDLKDVLNRIYELKREIKNKEEIQISHEEELERWRKLNRALQQTLADVEKDVHAILNRIGRDKKDE